jgi:anti-anti-sigma factor
MDFTVDISTHQGGAERIALDGRLDSNSAPDLERAVERLIETPPGVVFLDLDRLEYISSAGLRVIFRLQKALKREGGQLLMVNLKPQVRKVFEIIDALPSMAVFQSYDEMDEYLDIMQRREIEKQGGSVPD